MAEAAETPQLQNLRLRLSRAGEKMLLRVDADHPKGWQEHVPGSRLSRLQESLNGL